MERIYEPSWYCGEETEEFELIVTGKRYDAPPVDKSTQEERKKLVALLKRHDGTFNRWEFKRGRIWINGAPILFDDACRHLALRFSRRQYPPDVEEFLRCG